MGSLHEGAQKFLGSGREDTKGEEIEIDGLRSDLSILAALEWGQRGGGLHGKTKWKRS